jgi:hypothetical protein
VASPDPTPPARRSPLEHERDAMTTDTLADALPREIARISAKRDRWRDMMRAHPELGSGMGLTIAIMQAEIDRAVKAIASGDVIEMLNAHQALKDYSDAD